MATVTIGGVEVSTRECFSRLAKCFGQKIATDQIAEWVDALDGAADDELNLACSRLIKSSKFMPRPADMWTEIDRIRVEQAPAPEPVEEHWQRRSYTCRDCQDTGLRTVWHPKAMAASVRFVRGQMSEDVFRGRVSTCCVKCLCHNGKSKRLHRERRFEPARYAGEDYEPGELTYRSEIMIEVNVRLSLSERIESLLDWARNYQDPKPANYVPEFDDF